MVVDGKTGFIIEPNNINSLVRAMERVVEDGGLRRRLGKAARKRFEKDFSLAVMQKKLLKIYQNAILHKKQK